MLENEGRAPSKEDQVREANARDNKALGKASVDLSEVATDPEADLAAPELDLGSPGPREPPQRGRIPVIDPDAEKAPVMGKSSRDQIVKNFRAQREDQKKELADQDVAEFNHEGFPPELATEQVSMQPVDEGDDDQTVLAQPQDQEPEPEDGEPIYVIKVRGKEIELTEAQLTALADRIPGDGTPVQKAQMAAAGDDYVKEARATLDEVKRLAADIAAQRASPVATHPGNQNNTQTAEPAATPGETIEHPDNPFAKAVEAIQFGNPDEAARILQEATAKMVASQSLGVSEQTIVDRQMQSEITRADRIARDFERDNQDLAQDPFARAAIVDRCVRMQVDDLKSLFTTLKIDPTKFPKTPAEIAHFHSFYRSQGYELTDPSVMLNKSKDEFLAWKGGVKPAATTPTPTQRPRIEVTVDRRTRRAAIPSQPSRTVVPKPAARQQTPAVQDRSAIVQQMIASRKAPREARQQIVGRKA